MQTRSFTLELKDFHKAAKNMNGCITLKEQVQKDNFLRREHATQQSLTSLHLNDLQTQFPVSLATHPLSSAMEATLLGWGQMARDVMLKKQAAHSPPPWLGNLEQR